jgi:hypothetical protein
MNVSVSATQTKPKRRARAAAVSAAASDTVRTLRFSGHESFALRYAWLPKACNALRGDPFALSDDETAMVTLGIGKNMVRSLRFWLDATGVARPIPGQGFTLTPFADAVLAAGGFDPYLEDPKTLWLLHWNLATRSESPVFAWWYLFNDWTYPEFSRSEALRAFQQTSVDLGYSHSEVTLSQHLDVFLHTYYSRRAGVPREDSLDGPLVDLDLLQCVGDRQSASGRWENVYAFDRRPKPDITAAVFEYCIDDFWRRWRSSEQALTLGDILRGRCSPGRVFALTEHDVVERLDAYARADARSPFQYRPSAIQGLLFRRQDADSANMLAAVYGRELKHA